MFLRIRTLLNDTVSCSFFRRVSFSIKDYLDWWVVRESVKLTLKNKHFKQSDNIVSKSEITRLVVRMGKFPVKYTNY